MRQLVHSPFGDNNLVLINLQWRKFVLKCENVYKYFDHGCRCDASQFILTVFHKEMSEFCNVIYIVLPSQRNIEKQSDRENYCFWSIIPKSWKKERFFSRVKHTPVFWLFCQKIVENEQIIFVFCILFTKTSQEIRNFLRLSSFQFFIISFIRVFSWDLNF